MLFKIIVIIYFVFFLNLKYGTMANTKVTLYQPKLMPTFSFSINVFGLSCKKTLVLDEIGVVFKTLHFRQVNSSEYTEYD